MVRAIATVGYMGYLPRVGGLVGTALGLAMAIGLFLLTLSGPWMLAGWCFVFAATAWALPRALNSDAIHNQTIIIDRTMGIWLAAAPTIPAVPLALDLGLGPAILIICAPLAVFHLILMGPLRRMGTSARLWVRLGDDLIAGGIVMILSLVILTLVLLHHGTRPAL